MLGSGNDPYDDNMCDGDWINEQNPYREFSAYVLIKTEPSLKNKIADALKDQRIGEEICVISGAGYDVMTKIYGKDREYIVSEAEFIRKHIVGVKEVEIRDVDKKFSYLGPICCI